MIKVKNQEKSLEFDDADILFDFTEYIREYSKEEVNSKKVLLLDYFSPNTWKALEKIENLDQEEIAKLKEMSIYHCPYTDREYTSLIPTTIWTENPENYFEGTNYYFKDMACDDEWNKSQYKEKIESIHLSKIQKLMIGSGYTSCTLMSDGSTGMDKFFIDLDNGDILECVIYLWYNK